MELSSSYVNAMLRCLIRFFSLVEFYWTLCSKVRFSILHNINGFVLSLDEFFSNTFSEQFLNSSWIDESGLKEHQKKKIDNDTFEKKFLEPLEPFRLKIEQTQKFFCCSKNLSMSCQWQFFSPGTQALQD